MGVRKLACDMDFMAKSAVVVIQPKMQWEYGRGKVRWGKKRNEKQYTPNLCPETKGGPKSGGEKKSSIEVVVCNAA